MTSPQFAGFMTKEEKQESLLRDKPYILLLALNEACNLNCIFCYTSAGKKKQGQMSFQQYKNIIAEAKEIGIKKIIFPGRGEPFLDELFFDGRTFPLIEYASKQGIHVSTYTNATLITPELAEILFDYDTSFMCKLNSLDELVQNKLTGANSANKIYSGIQNLIDAGFASTTPTRLAIDSLISKDTYQEIPALVEWDVQRNIYPVVEGLLIKGRAAENLPELLMHPDLKTSFELEKNLRKNILEKFSAESDCMFFVGECDLDQYSIAIDYNGNFIECVAGRSDKIYGNAAEMSLSDAWSSPMLKGLREARYTGCKGKCPGRIYCESEFGKEKE